MVKKIIKKIKGMTLIEVLFSTAIFSFVAITLFALFKLGQTYWAKGMAYNTLQSEGKRILSLIQKDIRESDLNKSERYPKPYHFVIDGKTRDAILLSIPNPNYSGKAGEHPVIFRVYFATPDQNQAQGGTGSLFVVDFVPTSATGYNNAFNTLDSNLRSSITNGLTLNEINNIGSGPNDNPKRVKVSLLSNNLFSFSVQKTTSSFIVNTTLMRRSWGDQKLQQVSFNLEINPINTGQFPFNN